MDHHCNPAPRGFDEGQGCLSAATDSPLSTPGNMAASISLSVAESAIMAAFACASKQSLRNKPVGQALNGI